MRPERVARMLTHRRPRQSGRRRRACLRCTPERSWHYHRMAHRGTLRGAAGATSHADCGPPPDELATARGPARGRSAALAQGAALGLPGVARADQEIPGRALTRGQRGGRGRSASRLRLLRARGAQGTGGRTIRLPAFSAARGEPEAARRDARNTERHPAARANRGAADALWLRARQALVEHGFRLYTRQFMLLALAQAQ